MRYFLYLTVLLPAIAFFWNFQLLARLLDEQCVDAGGMHVLMLSLDLTPPYFLLRLHWFFFLQSIADMTGKKISVPNLFPEAPKKEMQTHELDCDEDAEDDGGESSSSSSAN